jgi:Family of unknown function (DUF6459)
MTVLAPARPPLRLVPAPSSAPPETDFGACDPPGGPSRYVQGSLALDYRLPNGLPAVPEVGPDLRLLPARRSAGPGPWPQPDGDPDDLGGPAATARQDLPDPRTWAARLGQAVIEVCTAGRPVTQLMRWTSGPVYAALASRYAPVVHRATARRRVVVDERVRSVHVCEPADGVAEVTLVVSGGARPHALALRLEGWDGRWVCTVCEWL